MISSATASASSLRPSFSSCPHLPLTAQATWKLQVRIRRAPESGAAMSSNAASASSPRSSAMSMPARLHERGCDHCARAPRRSAPRSGRRCRRPRSARRSTRPRLKSSAEFRARLRAGQLLQRAIRARAEARERLAVHREGLVGPLQVDERVPRADHRRRDLLAQGGLVRDRRTARAPRRPPRSPRRAAGAARRASSPFRRARTPPAPAARGRSASANLRAELRQGRDTPLQVGAVVGRRLAALAEDHPERAKLCSAIAASRPGATSNTSQTLAACGRTEHELARDLRDVGQDKTGDAEAQRDAVLPPQGSSDSPKRSSISARTTVISSLRSSTMSAERADGRTRARPACSTRRPRGLAEAHRSRRG